MKQLPPMPAAEAIARARSLVTRPYQTFGTEEGRRIMEGLLLALDKRSPSEPS